MREAKGAEAADLSLLMSKVWGARSQSSVATRPSNSTTGRPLLVLRSVFLCLFLYGGGAKTQGGFPSACMGYGCVVGVRVVKGCMQMARAPSNAVVGYMAVLWCMIKFVMW